MCKASQEILAYIEKSHGAVAKTTSDLFGDVFKELAELTKQNKIQEKQIKKLQAKEEESIVLLQAIVDGLERISKKLE